MVLVTPEKIASIMALAPVPHSFAELDALVSHGLPKNALKASVNSVCLNTEERCLASTILSGSATIILAGFS